MAGRLDGKVAIITGGTSGIGEATALRFAEEGARVVVAGRRAAEGEAVVRAIEGLGGAARFVQTDVARGADVAALVEATLAAYGRLDCAFNAAGVAASGGLTEASEEEWDRAAAINLKGTWLCLKYQIPAMLASGGGAIVNVGSIGAVAGFPGTGVYAATKGGVIALSRTAAVEYARQGIRINVVSPGPIETAMLADVPPELIAQIGAAYPLGRTGKPAEVAEAVVYLCSDAAAYVTGHNLMIDGGYSAA